MIRSFPFFTISPLTMMLLPLMHLFVHLCSIVPAAGVKPLVYSRHMFVLAYILFIWASMIPIVINSSDDPERAELSVACFWLICGVGALVLVGTYLVMSRHLLQLLRSHLASMAATEGLFMTSTTTNAPVPAPTAKITIPAVPTPNPRETVYHYTSGRGAPSSSSNNGSTPNSNNGGSNTGMVGASSQARARTTELQSVVNRLHFIVRLLQVCGSSCVPTYLLLALWPYLRGRMAYVIPAW
jgi:hypothetical protein